jgi:aspartyl-tRNA(Asn)/glutamyl-tRNA(Gln) amidotransferase subunit C
MISREEVEHIAKLSRIKLNQEEIEKFQKDFSNILNYVSLLKKAKTPKTETKLAEGNVMREDEAFPEKEEVIEKMLNSAPNKEGRQIKVKAILHE